MSEGEYRTWFALGFGSNAYNELRAILNDTQSMGVLEENTEIGGVGDE